MSPKAGRGSDQFVVRLPDGMRDRIAKSAEENGRSMNAEIVQALELAFPPQPSVDELLNNLYDVLDEVADPYSNAYHLRLSKKLEAIVFRLEAGVGGPTRKMNLLDPNTIEFNDEYRSILLRKLEEYRKRWRAEEGIRAKDLQLILESGYLQGFDEDLLRTELMILNEDKHIDDVYGSLIQLGLSTQRFAKGENPAPVLAEAIRRELQRRQDAATQEPQGLDKLLDWTELPKSPLDDE